MIINRNSWHYKVAAMGTFDCDIPRNLCPYFWLVAFKCFMLFAGFSALTLLSWAVGVDLATWLFAQVGVTLTNLGAAIPGILIGAIGIASFIGIGLSIAFGIYKLKERVKEKREEKRQAKIEAGEEIKPSLVIEFMKAKHEKVCPRLEFK